MLLLSMAVLNSGTTLLLTTFDQLYDEVHVSGPSFVRPPPPMVLSHMTGSFKVLKYMKIHHST